MGLQAEIGFVPRRANTMQRGLQRVAAVPSWSPVLTRLVTPIDRVLHGITGGKVSATAKLVAFPTVVLTTIGARSSGPRTTPLAAIPVNDDLAVIGSNGGSGEIPGWVFNLDACPEASISFEGHEVAVIARRADADEYEKAFAAAERIYAAFAGYRLRANYTIPVFMLSSKADSAQGRDSG